MHLVTFTALAEFPDRLEAHFNAFAPEHRQWSPPSWAGSPSEDFTALEQICHVRDIEIDGYQVRFARTVGEDNPFLPGVNGFVLRDERSYAEADPEEVLASFRAARARTLSILEGLTPEQWARTAEFEDYGSTTVVGLMHYLSSHDQQHLAGLQWLLGKTNAS